MSTNKQLIATIFILIGGILLVYAMITNNQNIYLKVVGIIILMFGLFRATRVWVDDNKTENDNE